MLVWVSAGYFKVPTKTVLQLPAVATEVLEAGEIPTEVGALNNIKLYYCIIYYIINELPEASSREAGLASTRYL